MQSSVSTKEAIRLREELRESREVLFWFFLGGCVLLHVALSFAFWNDQDAPQLVSGVIRYVIFLCIHLFGKDKLYANLMGNVSTYDRQSFLSKTPSFFLYLRGFNRDSYESEDRLKKKTDNGRTLPKFSEYFFCKLLSRKGPVCAIGMTKEMEAPIGAVRVYVDDSTWMKDVQEMMEKAQGIFILVNDSPSCIWEIEQGLEMLDKTVFIVDDIEKYETTRSVVSRSFPYSLKLPAINHGRDGLFVIRQTKGVLKPEMFDNSVEGYSQLLDEPLRRNEFPRIHDPYSLTSNEFLPSKKSVLICLGLALFLYFFLLAMKNH